MTIQNAVEAECTYGTLYSSLWRCKAVKMHSVKIVILCRKCAVLFLTWNTKMRHTIQQIAWAFHSSLQTVTCKHSKKEEELLRWIYLIRQIFSFKSFLIDSFNHNNKTFNWQIFLAHWIYCSFTFNLFWKISREENCGKCWYGLWF